jgi:2-methylcitrate dehydratase PrpD
MGLTQEVAKFVARTRYRDLPLDVIRLARGFILDGLGVALAGSTDECSRIGLALLPGTFARGLSDFGKAIRAVSTAVTG